MKTIATTPPWAHTAGRVIPVYGADLHLERRGPDCGRPLLLLHGGLGSLEDFGPLLPHLGAHPMVGLDTRGHGASTLGDEPLTYSRLAADAEEVIQATSLDRPLVIGHSDGGIAALVLAMRGRVELAGLVLIGVHAEIPTGEVRRIFDKLTEQSWRERFGAGVALYERVNPRPDFSKLFQAALAMWTNPDPSNYPGPQVAKIQIPVLQLVGDADHLVTMEQTLRLRSNLPDVRLGILPYGSHIVHQEHPERVAPFLLDFLEELNGI
ncbi:MAG: alpha/beta fold hydrolase [Vulcanimicrobiota bacterium]